MRDDEDDELEHEFQQFKQAACRPSPERRKRQREQFVKIPLWWAEQAARATKTPQAYVWIWLLRLAWEAKAKTFPLPNQKLRQAGVSCEIKRRALAKLEVAGLLKVERRHGKTPVVTLNY